MKKIVIISNIPVTADNHRAVLEGIFSDVSIDVVTISEIHGGLIASDVAVVTALDIVPYAQKYLDPKSRIVQSSYTLKKIQLEMIRSLEDAGPIVVAHETPMAAMARCTLLQRLGIPAEQMRVWYPGMDQNLLKGNIVLFGDMVLPSGYTEAIRIRGRMFSVITIFEIALGLGIHNITSTPSFEAYFQQVCTEFRPSINDLTVSEFNAIMGNDAQQKGLLAFTGDLRIFYCDTYVASLVQKPPKDLIGKQLFDALPFLRSCQIHRGNDAQEQLVIHDGKTYAAKLNIVLQTEQETGYLQISDYWAEEQRQGKLRRQVTEGRSKAKYTFRDIAGNSLALSECKAIAQRMARSDSSILITGGTGVGKELFAQSIHNASARSQQPFIAVNCGALVESLLESELFGYEKGAFTGANKNGKQGLFELAHKGTLFLDEIGEMPLHLQVRLLRVLQEKEVVRVGGDLVIPVDVRVIAATNKDIPELIRQNRFRSDLFYRLNVLPLYIPPLSARREDIPLLIDYFKQKLKADFTLTEQAKEQLLAYPFPGNVRELRNCVEYLSNLGLREIRPSDLPPYILYQTPGSTDIGSGPPPLALERSRSEAAPITSEQALILRAVASLNLSGLGAGRRSICAYLLQHHTPRPESSVRQALASLSELELVHIGRGRGGVRLTEQGRETLRDMDMSSLSWI